MKRPPSVAGFAQTRQAVGCGSGNCSEEPNVVSFVLHWQQAQADPTQPPPPPPLPPPQPHISMSQSDLVVGSLHQLKQQKDKRFQAQHPDNSSCSQGITEQPQERESRVGSPLSRTLHLGKTQLSVHPHCCSCTPQPTQASTGARAGLAWVPSLQHSAAAQTFTLSWADSNPEGLD